MMSLKTIPGFGKSGTSRILAARSTLMCAPHDGVAPARRAAGRAPAPARRARAGPRERPGAPRGSASAASAAAPRAGRPDCRPRSRTCAGAARRARRRPAARRRRRCRRRPRRTAPRAARSPSSSRPCCAVIPARSQRLARSISRSGAASPVRGRRRSFEVGEASSWRITRSGRNSSRCRRRIVSRRSTSSSPKSRYPPRVRFGESSPWSSR